jgi:hypothetical protein
VHTSFRYTHPDDVQLREKRRRLIVRRYYYEQQYRKTDMVIHALDMTLQQRKENRQHEHNKENTTRE